MQRACKSNLIPIALMTALNKTEGAVSDALFDRIAHTGRWKA
jgi:hypothetical protein